MAASIIYQRPIGRNIVAKLTNADIVWFADCDYIFGRDCLDYFGTLSDNIVYHPEVIYRIERKIKVQMIRAARVPNIIDVDTSHFKPDYLRRAIGGAQIISGDTTREMGYLPLDAEWQQSLDKYSRDDGSACWRNQFTTVEKLAIPAVYVM